MSSAAVCLKKPAFYNSPSSSFPLDSITPEAPRFTPPRISVLSSVAEMAEAMTASMAESGGVFELADLGAIDIEAPFPAIGELFRMMDAK